MPSRKSAKGKSASGSEGGPGRKRGRGRRVGEKIEEKLFKEAFKRAIAQPRLAFYSPVASCVLNYWKSAVPRFSISEFLAKVVEKEIAKAWPQLYEKTVKGLRRKVRMRRRSKRL